MIKVGDAELKDEFMEAKVFGLGREGDGKFAPGAELGLDSLVALVVYVTAGAPIGDVIVNVKADGNVVVNRRTLSGPELTELLKSLVQLNPDQAVVIRGDEAGAYKNIIDVLNVCTEAGVTNVAFATAK